MSSLYENQKAKGGIIDLEEEKNKYLIAITSISSVSIIKIGYRFFGVASLEPHVLLLLILVSIIITLYV